MSISITKRLALVCLVLFAALARPEAAPALDYLLGPQDRVRLKIYEWRASRDIIFEWTALNDEFTVGADGSLALPFVGSIPAAGRPPAALAATISERLQIQMGLGQAPDVAVEIVQFRPFYIVGDVERSGEFPYRPELTVLQAVSIAGGVRTREEGAGRIERELIAGRGDVSLLSLEQVSLTARRARLRAEQADAETVTFPKSLEDRRGDQVAGIMMQQERHIFEARRQGLRTQLRALSELRSFLERETGSLEKQLGFIDQQIESVKQELGAVTTLVEQGLAVAPRQLALERSLLQVQAERLSAETALLRARQEISRTDISMLELRNAWINEVANELREVEMQLSENARHADTALLLLDDSEMTAPRLMAMREKAARVRPVFTIVRPRGAAVVELPAEEGTSVEPGDTVKVELPLPATMELPGATDPALLGALPEGMLPEPEGGPAVVR